MPKNRASRKRYQPRHPQGTLPITIALSENARREMETASWLSLDSFQLHEGSFSAWSELAIRFRTGAMLTRLFSEKQIQIDIDRALAVLRTLYVRAQSGPNQVWSADEGECGALGGALDLVDSMQNNVTKRELIAAMQAVATEQHVNAKNDTWNIDDVLRPCAQLSPPHS